MHQYTYSVTQCPECLADLTRPLAVSVLYSGWAKGWAKGGAVVGSGYLSQDGQLVASRVLLDGGYHDRSECVACGADLSDYETESYREALP